MDAFQAALRLLPERIARPAASLRDRPVEEFRLRTGRPPSALIEGRERTFSGETISEEDLRRLLEKATGASLHAATTLAEGYLSCQGIRIGVCGTGIPQGHGERGFQSFSSAALRLPRECRGVCDGVLGEICENGFESTLVISRPGGGKTTALRELVRRLSDRGYRISVADERNELSASDRSGARFDLGACTDVLTGFRKAEGILLLLRAMNPQIIAVDEITRPEDVEAMAQAGGCGAELLASAHAPDRDGLLRRPLYRELLKLGIFRHLIVISGTGGERRYTAERL